MNIFVFGIIIFVLVYIFLNWFAKTSSRKIAQFLRRLAVILSVFLAAILAIGGKFLFSLPFLIILLSALKIKGLTADYNKNRKTKDVLRINGSKINDADTDETETNVVDDRNISFNLGGGRIEKDTYGQEVKISKLISRSVRPGQIIPFDVTPLVTTALGNNQRFLPLLIKGAHSNNKDTESKPNPQVGPQDARE